MTLDTCLQGCSHPVTVFHFAWFGTRNAQSGLTPASLSSQLMEKHSDVCKKVTSVFKEASLPAFDALKWNVSGALKKVFAGILNMF